MPRTEEPGGLSPWGCKESDTSEVNECTHVCVYVCVCVQLPLLRHFSRVRLRATPWTAAHQAPLSTGLPRQEYRSGLPFPSPVYMYTYHNIIISALKSVAKTTLRVIKYAIRFSCFLLLLSLFFPPSWFNFAFVLLDIYLDKGHNY